MIVLIGLGTNESDIAKTLEKELVDHIQTGGR
jgi:hypothetical protein